MEVTEIVERRVRAVGRHDCPKWRYLTPKTGQKWERGLFYKVCRIILVLFTERFLPNKMPNFTKTSLSIGARKIQPSFATCLVKLLGNCRIFIHPFREIKILGNCVILTIAVWHRTHTIPDTEQVEYGTK